MNMLTLWGFAPKLGLLLATVMCLPGGLVAQAASGAGKPGLFVCPPCSIDCHDRSYARPGACSGCGMKLVPSHTVPHVAVLTFGNADLLSLAGPATVFQTASMAHVFTVADTDEPLRVQAFQTLVPQYSFAKSPRVDVLIIPGGRGVRDAADDELLLKWVRERVVSARAVLATGAGVYLLARAGCLTTDKVVTSAPVRTLVTKAAPKVEVQTQLNRSESGKFFTATSAFHGMAQALEIVQGLAGAPKASRAAATLGIAWQPDPARKPLPRVRSPKRASGTPDKKGPVSPSPPVAAAEPRARSGSATASWPGWRGADGTCVSSESDWRDEGATAPMWQVEVGLGHSSLSIASGRAITVGFDAERSLDTVWCLDAETGAKIWSLSYPAKRSTAEHGHGGGTLTTPTIAGGRVFVSHRTGEMRCIDANNGKLIWHRRVAKDLGLKGTEYGFGASPVVVGDLVIYEVAAIVALRAETGEVVWKTRDLLGMYSTPSILRRGDRTLLAAFTKNGLHVLDAVDGSEQHEFSWRKGRTTVNASSPVAFGEKIFLSSGYNHGCAMLAFDGAVLKPLWESRVMRNKLSGSVHHAGHLYGFDEGTLKCIDVQGVERWRKRGLGMGALAIAGDRIVAMSARGDLVIADASPAGYKERSRRRVFDEGSCWTRPVVLDGRIYCRSGFGTVVCFDHRNH